MVFALGGYMGQLLRLKHVGGETKDVDVLGVDGICLLIRWGMAGMYKLHVKSNVLYGARTWSAESKDEAWRVWRTFQVPRKADIFKAYPNVKIREAEQAALAAYRKAGIV